MLGRLAAWSTWCVAVCCPEEVNRLSYVASASSPSALLHAATSPMEVEKCGANLQSYFGKIITPAFNTTRHNITSYHSHTRAKHFIHHTTPFHTTPKHNVNCTTHPITLYRITPQHKTISHTILYITALQHFTPQTTFHHTPNHTTQHHATEHITPHHATSYHTTDCTTPHHTKSHYTTAHYIKALRTPYEAYRTIPHDPAKNHHEQHFTEAPTYLLFW